MNARIVTAVIGILTILLGVTALVAPQFVMDRLVGFAVHPSFSANFVRGEVRAAYGGFLTVLGFLTALAAADPGANRARIFRIGLLWLGVCGGRLVGVVVDGNPGLWGWLSALVELAAGGLLIAAAQLSPAPTAAKG